ncbi:FMN-binding protein [Cetobacterium sp.]|uniref:FMN-binding protein n=1 Tax=Cetobacterium sp. TaxID=2071632 RepID=UPI003F2D01D9
MKKILIFSFLISTVTFSSESIGVGKDDKYGYEIKLKLEKDSNGKIKNIEILEDNTKKSISKKVLPKLIEEAKIKNSADIDSVAGATYTSDVFKKALKAALENIK